MILRWPEFRDLAARGVPSRSDLMEAFPDAANRAIAAANPIDPDAGLVDRLMSSALSVVKVRPVGDVEGDTADAIVARTEARLLDGNLDAALSEWSTLPEASQAATSDFGDFACSTGARRKADRVVADRRGTACCACFISKHRPTRRSMMIRLLFFVALVLVLGFGFAWLADRPGDLSIVWQDRRIEMSLMTAVTVMVSLVAAIMITWWLIRTIWLFSTHGQPLFPGQQARPRLSGAVHGASGRRCR
jgi:hypothetical protein